MEKSNNMTRYFYIRNFEIPKYRPFHIWSFQMLTRTLFWAIFSSFQRNFCSSRFRILLNFVNSSWTNLSVQVFPIRNFPSYFHRQSARKRNSWTTFSYNKRSVTFFFSLAFPAHWHRHLKLRLGLNFLLI